MDDFCLKSEPLPPDTEKSRVLLFCRINIAAACSKKQNENNLHSNHSQDIPGAVKEDLHKAKSNVGGKQARLRDKRKKNCA